MDNLSNLFRLGLRRFLKKLKERKGETDVTTPPRTNEPNPPVSPVNPPPTEPEVTPPVTPAVPAEEETLYAGRFKTPEELENAYKESSTEGQRLAGEVKRLTQMVQSALTPGEKKEVEEKVTDLTKHFDNNTARILTNYFNNLVETKFANFSQLTQEQSELETQMSEVWEETKKLFPDAANPKSKLFIRANEILTERGLVYQDEKTGKQVLTTPFAYRIAVEAATVELSRQTPNANKGKLGAVAGKGSKSVSQGKLTYEQYQALTDEQKDAYDKS